MKKIGSRSVAVFVIACLVILELVSYIGKEYENGRDWAIYFASFNSDSEGTLYDSSGVTLARFDRQTKAFADDAETRTANYHVTGDYWGRTGSGVISRFWSSAQNYSFLTGTTRSSLSALTLTIDSRLNNYAYDLLRENGKGAVMIMNYRTGEVIALVSSPSIDPLDEDAEPEEGTYINRCLAASFIPGSTFKLITAAAAIENIPDLDEQHFMCYGESEIAGVKITCTTMHGYQTFEEALANSCNCAFADITVQLGQNRMIKYVTDYGFLDRHDLDGIPTNAGTFPLEFVGDPELAWAGIGQSVDTMCPYTMLRYVSAIANGGVLAEPTMVKSRISVSGSQESDVKSEKQYTQLVKPKTAARMRELMINNVETHYEGEVNFPGLTLGAKTGTAEITEEVSHSWFTGFLVDEAHPYAFVSIVEEGGFGLWTAGRMMNDILHYAVSLDAPSPSTLKQTAQQPSAPAPASENNYTESSITETD